MREINKRYILYKKGNFHEEWEIDFELKKLKKKLQMTMILFLLKVKLELLFSKKIGKIINILITAVHL